MEPFDPFKRRCLVCRATWWLWEYGMGWKAFVDRKAADEPFRRLQTTREDDLIESCRSGRMSILDLQEPPKMPLLIITKHL